MNGEFRDFKDFTTVELAAVNLISKASPYADEVRDALMQIDPLLAQAMLLLVMAMMAKTREKLEMGVN